MSTRNVLLTERQTVRLKALRAAARAGAEALDRTEFREFGTIEELQAYLNDLSERIISRIAE